MLALLPRSVHGLSHLQTHFSQSLVGHLKFISMYSRWKRVQLEWSHLLLSLEICPLSISFIQNYRFFLSTYAHMPPNIHHCADLLTKTIKTHLRHTCPVQEISFCLSVYLTVFQKCWLWRMRCLSNDLVEICIWPTIQTKAIKHRHACKMILITNALDSQILAWHGSWRTLNPLELAGPLLILLISTVSTGYLL